MYNYPQNNFSNNTNIVDQLNSPLIDQHILRTTDINNPQPKQIVLIGDHATILKLILEILTTKGYSVIDFIDHREAVKYIKNNYLDIDLIIADVTLPEVNGMQLIETLRNNHTLNKIPIISALNTNLSQQAINRPDKNIYFLKKPFGGKQLVKIIKHVLTN